MTSRGRSGARSAISSVSRFSVAATSSSLVHVLDQRLAHRVRDLEQDLAVALGLDQVPDDQALVERQRLEDVGDVRRVQLIELFLQLDQVQLVDEPFDQPLPGHVLAARGLLGNAVPAQQLRDLLEDGLAVRRLVPALLHELDLE